MEREKKLNEESLMNQVTQLQNDKDELKTEIFKLKHKVEKVRVFGIYLDLWPLLANPGKLIRKFSEISVFFILDELSSNML